MEWPTYSDWHSQGKAPCWKDTLQVPFLPIPTLVAGSNLIQHFPTSPASCAWMPSVSSDFKLQSVTVPLNSLPDQWKLGGPWHWASQQLKASSCPWVVLTRISPLRGEEMLGSWQGAPASWLLTSKTRGSTEIQPKHVPTPCWCKFIFY